MRPILPATALALCLLTAPAAAVTAAAVPAAAVPAAAVPGGAESMAAMPAAAVPAAVAPTPAGPSDLAVPSDLRAVGVSFRGSGGLTLHGTVLSPATAGPARPGIVLVHGAGTGTPRTKLMGEAVEFARRGLAVLIYDKRSEGYSLFRRSYSQLADDALGAVAALRSQPGVDPAKVGIWGLSEGGWVAPIAASRSADIAFVVLVGANALQPLRQQTWAVAAGLRKAGVSGSLVDRAELNLYRTIADGGMFPEPYHDPEPTLAAVRQPVLGVWGTHDLLTPPRETPPLLAAALEKGGNRHYTFRFFPDADHAAHRTPDGGVTRLPELAPGYADLVGSWVADVTAGRAPVARVSGPAPVQESPTVPVDPPSWWESAALQLAVLVVLVAAFAAYPVVALVRRLRGRRPAPAAGAARLLSAGGLVAVFGSFSYLVYLMMTGGKLAAPGPVVAGRPLIWLALQALAVVSVVATAGTALAWRRARGSAPRGERVRLGLLLAGGTVFVPWALYWGLLLP
ncbi:MULTISPECIES: alpha/beta hydrolase family protein [Streptosporangium]|uniref:Dienelactone hydrolase n=1 Tax=Streptosporangium brasiliense TaxID=47480 RepID=A0ABT9QY55_9ACTN|nr:prolyl oligopeptidase family serine peptidase [Streptosporangium brasiliense]MDP9861100.1 dienelactone hydrolase [Streptosporangium brasiliense]